MRIKKEASKEEFSAAISRIDSLNDEELINEFLRLNTNSHEEFQKIFYSSFEKTPDEMFEMISASSHKLLKKKKPAIVNLLPYLKVVVKHITKTRDKYITQEGDTYTIELCRIMDNLSFIKTLINTLVMEIEKGYSAVLSVDFGSSKELLLKKFDSFLSEELSKSPIHQNRKKIRMQSDKKLRQYLKVWQLKKIGVKFDRISIILNEDVSTVKKQFYKAFEIIYGCEYSEDKFKEMAIKQNSFNLCQNCPKRSNCQSLCDEANEYANLDEKYLREKLVDNSIFNMDQENYDMDSNGEIEQY